jgi:hypothetical protein
MIYLQGYHSDIKAKAYAQQWMAAKWSYNFHISDTKIILKSNLRDEVLSMSCKEAIKYL